MTAILIIGLLVVAIYGVRLIAERARIVGFGLVVLSLVGIPLVMFPEASTDLANLLGVGRGADLLVYVLFVLVLLSLIVLHASLRNVKSEMTLVVRALAIATERRSKNRDGGNI